MLASCMMKPVASTMNVNGTYSMSLHSFLNSIVLPSKGGCSIIITLAYKFVEVQILRLEKGVQIASEMVAASREEMCMEHCMEVLSSVFPFTIHWQQIDSSSVVLISTHSSANTEKYGLDVKLSINFLYLAKYQWPLAASLLEFGCVLSILRPLFNMLLEKPISSCNLQLNYSWSKVVVRGRRFLAMQERDWSQ